MCIRDRSKSTETTNDRVPRVLVRFGKHHRVYGNTIECMETPIERVETSSSVWKHHRAWGNTRESWGNTHRAWGNVGVHRGVAEGGPRRAGLSERGDAGCGKALRSRCRGFHSMKDTYVRIFSSHASATSFHDGSDSIAFFLIIWRHFLTVASSLAKFEILFATSS